jgi:hypothetical protein
VGGCSWPRSRPSGLFSVHCSLATVGTFLGLRLAPAERLSYRTAVSLAVIYLVFCFLTSFIPLDPTVIFREGRASGLEFYTRSILFLVLISCVFPYLIALTWRLTIVGGGRERR